MYDKEFAREILTQIYQATQTVLERFEPIINRQMVSRLRFQAWKSLTPFVCNSSPSGKD
jgi:hypothetical protein